MKYYKLILWTWLAIISTNSFAQAQADYFEDKFNPERISEEEGARRINEFRNFRYNGDYSLQFELIHLPRRGGRDIYTGTLWGSWNTEGPVTRVELRSSNKDQKTIRLLIQSGRDAKIWFLDQEGKVKALDQKDWFNPLIQNTVYTAFDLSLSFIFWDRFAYEGPKRLKGRPTQAFMMYPPAELVKVYPGLGGVKIAMDGEYNVLMQADVLNCEGISTKSIKLNNFQKIQDQYIIRQMDVVDEVTHDKTRLEVVSAAMNLTIDPQFFKPESLSGKNPEINRNQYSFLN